MFPIAKQIKQRSPAVTEIRLLFQITPGDCQTSKKLEKCQAKRQQITVPFRKKYFCKLGPGEKKFCYKSTLHDSEETEPGRL